MRIAYLAHVFLGSVVFLVLGTLMYVFGMEPDGLTPEVALRQAAPFFGMSLCLLVLALASLRSSRWAPLITMFPYALVAYRLVRMLIVYGPSPQVIGFLLFMVVGVGLCGAVAWRGFRKVK